eukprot:CAMPEP_0206297888 /NCGR_PEP_ID=MMETSP0106_2-20121207/6406_1 /ASSEMBLY_ACC=CAM_ASM_000206 /TAXON_ID=81532 /ORGANISM="Acanthoeca-like sp., Strain 10tr" /LENGTH=187 /DNA_ID=CAMNT_0053728571 /DNA_START=123 /DNA_END=686 /DNA_ORIENTATION=-
MAARRVVFLDVDGVLHPLNAKGHPANASLDALVARADAEATHSDDEVWEFPVVAGEFGVPQMTQLARAVAASGAAIVLSSTWREGTASRLAVVRQLTAYGIPEPMGCTPRVGNGSTRQRPAEIRAWLDSHPEVVQWVAVDDADLGGDDVPHALEPERVVRCDPGRGLTPADADGIIAGLADGGVVNS